MAAYGQNTGFATVFCPTGHPVRDNPRPVGAMLLFFVRAITTPPPIFFKEFLSSHPQWNILLSCDLNGNNNAYIIRNKNHCHFFSSCVPVFRIQLITIALFERRKNTFNFTSLMINCIPYRRKNFPQSICVRPRI